MGGSPPPSCVTLVVLTFGSNLPTNPSEVVTRIAREGRRLIRRTALLGPAFVAAIGYVDPGNYATNIPAGAEYGYMPLGVVVWINLMAVLIQLMSSKLCLATGLRLAASPRPRLPPWAIWTYWLWAPVLRHDGKGPGKLA
jgi:Mn2+/Fe2+ NRAMP family transporter